MKSNPMLFTMPYEMHLIRPKSGVIVEVERLTFEGGEKSGVG